MENKQEVFLASKTRRELAISLGVEYKILTYNLYKLSDDSKYKTFEIKKKNNGTRKIIAPNSGIKTIQRNLSKILLDIYPIKNCIHGYVKNRNILSNAEGHVRKRFLVNIDLKDFFPSINFGRIRGIFKSYPFNFNDEIATTLAQICCYKGYLPQGAPTSPIISNIICRRLDNQLLDLSKKGKFNYTRYADDITFSTNKSIIPQEIGKTITNELELSTELIQIINQNGFQLNENKTRYATKDNRQEVTGLITNSFPNIKRSYIKNIRAMIHALEKFGVTNAAKEHFSKYNYKNKKTKNEEVSFLRELTGKVGFIGMVRGKDDSIYKNLHERLIRCYPDAKLTILKRETNEIDIPMLFGEGKTDWKHLKAALQYYQSIGEYNDISISFKEYKDTDLMNNKELINMCTGLSKYIYQKNKVICLFDRDDKIINGKASANGKDYKYWGNNVYSALLPKPKHRDFEEICIEHYYLDEEIKILDKNNRRLFLSDEFNKLDGNHMHEDLIFPNINFLAPNYPRIIDNKVFNPNTGNTKCLSKNIFAENILTKEPNYSSIKFEHFKNIFDLLKEIINHSPN